MSTEKIIIKALNNPQNPKLKLKYVGANEYAGAKIGPDGKVITGWDEESFEFNFIEDVKEREAKRKKLKQERIELERLLALELGPNSEYWNTFFIVLSDEDITLDPINPRDRLLEKFLIANRYVAPSEESIYDDERYSNCIYYMHRETEVVSKKSDKLRQKDKAKSKLFTLSDENPGKFKLVASYILGYEIDNVDEAYTKISERFEAPEEAKASAYVKEFLAVTEKSHEELVVKQILDAAIKDRLVTVTKKIVRRGDMILGNTKDEAIQFLLHPENSAEFKSLQREVKNK